MILTVTMNPSVDTRYQLDKLVIDDVNRVTPEKTAGGKGLNVSRVLLQLGDDVVATGLLGGHMGAYMAELMDADGVKNDFVPIAGETRICLNILHEGNQTELLESGPQIAPAELDAFTAKFAELAAKADVVTLSGSLPRGVDAGYYAELVKIAEGAGAKVLLDTSGASLEAALDLSFVYEETAPLYSEKYGRPPIDPVVIVKYLLVGFLYGIPSERQIERRVQTDIALRWYLGLDLFDRVPDHSTVSQLRRRKPSFRKVFRRLFEEVVGQCIEKGLVSGRVVGADSTHVRANASRASEELVEVAEEAGVYWERLDDYEEEGLEELERRTGKRRKKRTKQIKRDNRRTHKRVSRTDPESGHLKRPGKPEGPHYLAHQAVDSDYGIIVGQTVTAGDVNDSVPFLGLIEHIHENVVPIQAATADAAYDFPLAHRALGELGIDFFVRPQKTAARVSVQFTRDDFCRDENRDVYLCPIGKELCLRRLARSASGLFWEYQADKRDCALCPLREKCLRESDKRGARKVSVSYFAADRQRNLERRSSPEYREALKLRQVWCEGSFSAQKREHNLARVLRRGLEAAEDHCLLSATALNLKRMIKHAG